MRMRYGLTYEESPDWQRYANVLTGYRAGGNYWQATASLFRWHTETLNAWSMIAISATRIGCFVHYLLDTRAARDDEPSDTWIFTILLMSSLLHLPFTVGFHLFMPISAETCHLWRRLDVVAIFYTTAMVTFCSAWYTFPACSFVVWMTVTVYIAQTSASKFWSYDVSQKLNPIRQAGFVGATCMCAWLPMVIGSRWNRQEWTMSTTGATLVGVGLFGGGAAYGLGIPEVWSPGTFDTFGHSHQVMHVGIFMVKLGEFLYVYGRDFSARALRTS